MALLAVVFSLVAMALPAGAHSAAIDISVPCPSTTPSAGFTDIGGFDSQTQLAINCLVMYGISNGTTATAYSPNGAVLRWQMALFLVRQAADHGIAIPAEASQGYTDIGGLPQATQDAINQVTQLGISTGTSPTTFSPNDPVTRWQMALFLRRLALAAGVSVTDDPAHNQFSDIGAYSSEIQVAINFLADGHIALGVGGSLFDGNSNVLRWQMALFLTRVLAADAPQSPPTLVTVAPGDTAARALGDFRNFTAFFRNADGSPFTGNIGLALFAVSGGVIEWDGAPAADATFESVSDGLNVVGPVAEGTVGADGVVTFTIRHGGGGPESVVVIGWQDLNDDNDPEITGNSPPLEPYAAGGRTDFMAGILPDCGGPTPVSGFAPISGVDTVANRIEVVATCSLYYDGNDSFSIEGVPATMAVFEAALSPGDEITANPYDATFNNQSVFDVSIDNAPGTVIIEMSAADNFGGTSGLLEVDDVIRIDFSEDVVVSPGATIQLRDPDGTTATITCGVDASCVSGPADQLLITIDVALTTSGGTPGIENQAEITAVGGISAADNGAPVNAADSSVLTRTFSGF